MLSLGVVSSLLKTLEGYVPYEIMLIDKDGVVVHAPDKGRRGTIHALAHELLNSLQEQVIVLSEDIQHLRGNEAGVYVPLHVNQEKVGVLAVLGTDEACVSIAHMARICIEKTLVLELCRYHSQVDTEQYLQRLIYNTTIPKEDLDHLVRIAHIQADIPRTPILFVVHQDVGGRLVKISADEVRRCILASNIYEKTDLLCRTLDNNVIWFKTIRIKKKLCSLAGESILNAEIETVMNAIKDVCYSAYVGTSQNKLQNYGMAYRQCEWLRLDICTMGIYYLHHHLLRYLSSKISRAEYDSLFSVTCSAMDSSAIENFCEMMEALIQCDYNLTRVAEKLFIHKNTALYRLDKIRNLFDVNPLVNIHERTYLEVLYHYFKSYPSAFPK